MAAPVLNLPPLRRDLAATYDPRVGMETMMNTGMSEEVSFLPSRSTGNYREIVIPLNEQNLQGNNNTNNSQFQESFVQLLHQIVASAQNSGGNSAQAGGAREDELPPNPSERPLTGRMGKQTGGRPSLM